MRKTVFLFSIALILWGIPIPGYASGELPSLVHDIGFCIMLAGILAILFTKFNIPNIAAFLVAGAILGPIGTQVVSDPGNIDTISQFGLVLLLFLIGLELDIRKLLASGKTILLSGFFQFPLCIAFGFGAAKLLIWAGIGKSLMPAGESGYVPIYIGFLFAASSTLLVVKLFQETFQMDTTVGRVSLGILIFQDIWSIIIIAVQPNFANPEIVPILLSFLGIGVLAAGAVLGAKYLIPIGFKWIAKMPELILVAALAWCFVVVFAGSNLDFLTETLFGFNWHLAVGSSMGALIAGISIANLPYSTDVLGKVGIVKDFFVTLFFVGLGMGIPVPDGLGVLGMALLFSALTILARYVVFFPLLFYTGLDRRNAMVSSTRLAQVSEFTLVIAYAGLQLGHIDSNLNSTIIFTFVITALLTPTLYHKADALHDKLAPLLERLGFKSPLETGAGEDESYSVAFLGFHRVASSLLYDLKLKNPNLLKSILVVDFNVGIHRKIAAYGPTVRYGDLSNAETLHHAGVDKAKVIVCTIQDDLLKGTSTLKIVEEVRRISPHSVIIANALGLEESRKLYEIGADYVLLPRVETAEVITEAITHALAGEISKYRSQQENNKGKWHERDEIFP
ncbi:MAG: cation:proton antiporter [Thermodesulfobacteriota bacterium]